MILKALEIQVTGHGLLSKKMILSGVASLGENTEEQLYPRRLELQLF